MIGGITGVAQGQTLVYSFTFYTVMCFGKPTSAFRSCVCDAIPVCHEMLLFVASRQDVIGSFTICDQLCRHCPGLANCLLTSAPQCTYSVTVVLVLCHQ